MDISTILQSEQSNFQDKSHILNAEMRIITEIVNIDKDDIALQKQWYFCDLDKPLTLAAANFELIEIAIENKEPLDIRVQIALSSTGKHIVSYRKVITTRGIHLKQLIASSRLNSIAITDSKKSFQVLPVLINKAHEISSPFDGTDEKQQVMDFFKMDNTDWRSINSLADLLTSKQHQITAWDRLAYRLDQKLFYSNITTILAQTFRQLDQHGIKYLITVSEKNIAHYIIDELNRISHHRLLSLAKKCTLDSDDRQTSNTKFLGLLNTHKLAAAFDTIPPEYLESFWNNVRRNRVLDIEAQIKNQVGL